MTTNDNAVAAPAAAEVLPRKMRWFDGFAMAMTMPAALVATLGASIAGLGGRGAVGVGDLSVIISLCEHWS